MSTRPNPKLPRRRNRANSAGRFTRVCVSSIASMVMAIPRPEDVALCAIGRNAIDGCQRIRWDHCAPPSDHVAIVVVVRWLDQNKLELLGGHGDIYHKRCSHQMRGNLT